MWVNVSTLSIGAEDTFTAHLAPGIIQGGQMEPLDQVRVLSFAFILVVSGFFYCFAIRNGSFWIDRPARCHPKQLC